MRRDRSVAAGRMAGIFVIATAAIVLISTATSAVLDRLTTIPLGRGTATITWTGSTGVTPTIESITGTAGGYQVHGSGHVPRLSGTTGSASTVPSQLPIADVAGTIGGTRFTVNIVLTFPASLTSNKPRSFGYVTGTFRGEPVRATLTADLKSTSPSFGFTGTIGSLHVSGVISQPIQHGKSETAHARFDVTR